MSGEGRPDIKGFVMAIALIAAVSIFSLIFLGGQISESFGGVGSSV